MTLDRRLVLALPALLLAISIQQVARLEARDQALSAAQSTTAETAVSFLKHLEKAEISAAMELWDPATVTDKLKVRIDKMAAKVIKSGGIKKIDVGKCEPRRIKRFEQKLGGNIDVVPLEITCENESLILAVFSLRKIDDRYRIFQLESLKEWGGTASWDEELRYSD
jgi:hypothetical protein